MKKHEFMTRLANALHSPSSVCSASLRSQLPLIGEAFVRCGGESIPQSPSAPAPFTQGGLGVRAKKAFPS